MAYIEFFDKVASENIYACLAMATDKVVFIGDKFKVMNAYVNRYKKVFGEKDIEFVIKTSPKGKLDEAVGVIAETVEEYDECIFDITGGDEIYMLALGIVCEKYKGKKIKIHKFSVKNNKIYDCDTNGVITSFEDRKSVV